MRFIREMIARKAAGEDDPKEFEVEGLNGPAPQDDSPDGDDHLVASEGAGFEDELEEATPVVESIDEDIHANSDAPTTEFQPVFDEAGDDFDEEAELDALDAAFPDIADSDDTVEQLFPAETSSEPNDEMFDDIPETPADEPMPQLTAEDIQRAMKNRKKIWHDLPEDDDTSMFDNDDFDSAVTRPIRRPSAMRGNSPVSVPLELVNPVEVEEEPAMQAPEAPSVAEPEPEMAAMIADEPLADEVALEEPVLEEPQAHSEPVEVVVDEVAEDDDANWPQPAGQEPEMVEESAPEMEQPAAPIPNAPDIQALMARAALEAAGAPVPPVSNETAPVEEPAKPTRRGRVKTRLLGFQPDEPEKNIFETAGAAATSEPDMFPVGWMVVVRGPGRGASFCLHNGVSLIGRGDDQAVRLDFGDNSISRNNHASVAFDDESNQFFLGHGGKSNIVRLNKKPVLSTEELSDGDEIRLGETTLRFAAFCGTDFGWSEENDDGAGNAVNG